jgi:hypothetical protein
MTETAPRETPRWVEIVELSVLALVATATAWSGYQATTWGGRQSQLYGQASSTRFEADAAATFGGQELAADATIFTAWLQAHDAGNRTLQTELERRFTPDYAEAFQDWLDADPFHNPDAPPGPAAVPGYTNPGLAKAAQLNAQASADFTAGTEARETANKYARDTVLFATVIFFVATGQRFTRRGVRLGANAIAIALLVYTLTTLATLPRA